MKKLLFAHIIVFLLSACQKNKECCVVVEAFVDVSVVEKATGKDLLNPANANHFDIDDVLLQFSTNPSQKSSIGSIQTSKPLFFENNGKFYLRIFPTTSEALAQEHSVKIYWNDTNVDEIKFQLNHQGQNVYTDKIYLNGNISWQQTDGYRSITISK